MWCVIVPLNQYDDDDDDVNEGLNCIGAISQTRPMPEHAHSSYVCLIHGAVNPLWAF